MRVLMVVLEDFPGSENRVQRQALALQAAGHEVRVLCATGSSVEDEWHGIRIVRSRVRRKKRGGTRRRLWEYIAFPISAARLIRALMRDFDPDVIQVANMPDWLIFSAVFGTLGARRPLVLDLHDPMPELLAARGGRTRVRNMLEVLEGVSLRRADLLLVPTNGCRLALARRHGADAIVVPNAVDKEVFAAPRRASLEREDGRTRVVYHGTIAARFGIELLARAAELLKERGVDVTFDVYGDGDHLPRLQAIVASSGLASSVHLHGQVPAADVPGLIDGADVGVVPYLGSEFMDLAYSTKAFEYAALGVPMAVADLASLRDQLGDEAAVFFRPGDPAALADAIEALLGSADLRSACAEAAYCRACEYDWRLWGPRYVERLASLVPGATAEEAALVGRSA